jgi:2-haloacid dehalogenase
VTFGQQPEPWPDPVPALDRIASRFPVVGMSNAGHSALTRISTPGFAAA